MERDVRAAGAAVAAAAGANRWSHAELATRAGVDTGTLGDFMAGKRWPRNTTRAKIEDALGWQPGTIARIADGDDPGSDVVPPAQDDPSHLPLGSGVDPIDLAELSPEDREWMRTTYERLRKQRGE